MANLTISLDDGILKRARIRALEQGSSVNAIIREYLEAYAGGNPVREEAVKHLLKISRGASARSGGRRWTRDELHER